MGGTHEPVLVREVLAALDPRADGIYMDCTFGRGGHARALLARLGPAGRVVALDRDPEAVAAGRFLATSDQRLSVEQAPFSRMAEVARAKQIFGRVNGVLLDLGVSSPQLEDPRRGFGFRADGPLDMRMDPGAGPSAAEWLRAAGEREIADVLKRFGEERFARRIAVAIVRERRVQPVQTTRRLAEIVARANPAWERDRHPATRSFQAIRIFVNRELEELREALDQVVDVLAGGGRLAVISFHSLEDRIVKRFIRSRSRPAPLPRGMPVAQPGADETPLCPVGRAQRPGAAEIARNPRARSAILRVAEKRA